MLLKVKCQSFKEKNNVSPNTTNVVFIKPFWFFWDMCMVLFFYFE